MSRAIVVVILLGPLAACRPAAAPPPSAPSADPGVSMNPVDPVGPDAAPPDVGPPAAVLAAPAWIFHYATQDRTETWTLRFADGVALVDVEGAQTTHYRGTATDGASLVLEVSAPTAKLSLACKREQRPLSTKCNDAKAKPVDVLACYHPDFGSPMTFGAAPGIAYVVDASCTGFRLVR